MNKPWKVWLVLVGVFLAGAVAGGFTALWAAKKLVPKRGGAEHFVQMHLQRLSRELQLTAQQRAEVETILKETSDELRTLRREISAISTRMDARIEPLLTPEQRTRFEQIQKQWRERMKWRSAPSSRGEGRSGPPGEPPPPPS